MTQPVAFLRTAICPSCWHKFNPADCVYISKHESLIGDPIAGEHEQMRFLPSRFNIDCQAIDPSGMNCHQLACPKCHLEIARPSLELEPLFLSIVGAPASGKSFLLGSMVWKLRGLLHQFGYRLTDADPTMNQTIHSYEQTLFLAENPNEPVSIRKTELDGSDLYASVRFGAQEQRLPKPFLFTIDSQSNENEGRLLVLYDNAGEHFLPGSDKAGAPVTEHLAKSGAIIFVFDATQDPRLRKYCLEDDPQIKHGSASTGSVGTRQETILSEAASRIRKHLGISTKKLHDRPLVIALGKADAWIHNVPDVDISTEPFLDSETEGENKLDIPRIENASHSCERWINTYCPEFVAAARGFCKEVIFIPLSATGCSPELVTDEDTRFYGVKPSNISPQWVTVPFLYCIRKIIKV